MQEKAAQASHQLLYACMALMPLSGYAGSNFGKYPVKSFGYALPQLGWESALLQNLFRQAHATLAWLLFALIVLHMLAVVYHLVKSGRTILRRMSPH
ncbi:cytochrome b [Herbaspirillum sp. GCM10030257]|uniref:cytochrome b n=1 Tax=Herbaspirillum sp. GCM10030257 TaxID=3273393 RepID=UPI003610E04D